MKWGKETNVKVPKGETTPRIPKVVGPETEVTKAKKKTKTPTAEKIIKNII